jgi:hypothetical protein
VKCDARTPKSGAISNVQNTNFQDETSQRVATGVLYFGNLNFESIRRCSEPTLSEAEQDKLVSHFE